MLTFFQLLRVEGMFAVVLPRTASTALGSAAWRAAVLAEGTFTSACYIENKGRWAFDMEPRYTIGLNVATRGSGDIVRWSGPFANEREFLAGSELFIEAPKAKFASWSQGASFPMIPSAKSMEVFLRIRESPSIGSQRSDLAFVPVQGDFNQTTEAALWSVGVLNGELPVMKGASFDLWAPANGQLHGSTSQVRVQSRFIEKLRRQVRTSSSAYFGMDVDRLIESHRLPHEAPRIAFRDVARATDSRIVIASLVPPAILTNKAPFLLRRSDGSRGEAFLLGVACSIPFDWYARRFVELSLNFYIFNWLPVPHFQEDSVLGRRIVHVSGRLAAMDDRYAEWAADVGVPAGSVKTQTEKDDLIAELDALVSLLYGLTESQVEHVFTTFHRGWDCTARLEAVLKHYAVWKAKT